MSKAIKLGSRLNTIAELIIQSDKAAPFNQLWDCCCDHGYLGIALLNYYSEQKLPQPTINFVDQVEQITRPLRTRLNELEHKNYTVQTQDVGLLQFSIEHSHCIVLAGITTNGMVKLIKQLLQSHTQALNFVLCPTRDTYQLRKYLVTR